MSRPAVSAVGRAVDWNLAAGLGGKLARPEPPATDYTRTQVRMQLAEAARAAETPVREVTGLTEGGEIPEARIVDRPEWIRAAAQSMRVMTGGDPAARPSMISGRIAGAQTGAVLETWVPWSRGATVVTPGPSEELRGPALGSFLRCFRSGMSANSTRSRRECWVVRPPRPRWGGIDGPTVIDLDDTIVEVHGYAKQGAGFGYPGSAA